MIFKCWIWAVTFRLNCIWLLFRCGIFLLRFCQLESLCMIFLHKQFLFIKQHIMLLSNWLLIFTWPPWIVQRIRIMFQSYFWNYLYGRTLNSSGKNFYILLAICIQATAVHFSLDFPMWNWWMQALAALSATFLLMKHL